MLNEREDHQYPAGSPVSVTERMDGLELVVRKRALNKWIDAVLLSIHEVFPVAEELGQFLCWRWSIESLSSRAIGEPTVAENFVCTPISFAIASMVASTSIEPRDFSMFLHELPGALRLWTSSNEFRLGAEDIFPGDANKAAKALAAK